MAKIILNITFILIIGLVTGLTVTSKSFANYMDDYYKTFDKNKCELPEVDSDQDFPTFFQDRPGICYACAVGGVLQQIFPQKKINFLNLILSANNGSLTVGGLPTDFLQSIRKKGKVKSQTCAYPNYQQIIAVLNNIFSAIKAKNTCQVQEPILDTTAFEVLLTIMKQTRKVDTTILNKIAVELLKFKYVNISELQDQEIELDEILKFSCDFTPESGNEIALDNFNIHTYHPHLLDDGWNETYEVIHSTTVKGNPPLPMIYTFFTNAQKDRGHSIIVDSVSEICCQQDLPLQKQCHKALSIRDSNGFTGWVKAPELLMQKVRFPLTWAVPFTDSKESVEEVISNDDLYHVLYSPDWSKKLLSQSRSYVKINDSKEPALLIAITRNDLSNAKWILKNGLYSDEDKSPAEAYLQLAVREKNVDMIKLLLGNDQYMKNLNLHPQQFQSLLELLEQLGQSGQLELELISAICEKLILNNNEYVKVLINFMNKDQTDPNSSSDSRIKYQILANLFLNPQNKDFLAKNRSQYKYDVLSLGGVIKKAAASGGYYPQKFVASLLMNLYPDRLNELQACFDRWKGVSDPSHGDFSIKTLSCRMKIMKLLSDADAAELKESVDISTIDVIPLSLALKSKDLAAVKWSYKNRPHSIEMETEEVDMIGLALDADPESDDGELIVLIAEQQGLKDSHRERIIALIEEDVSGVQEKIGNGNGNGNGKRKGKEEMLMVKRMKTVITLLAHEKNAHFLNQSNYPKEKFIKVILRILDLKFLDNQDNLMAQEYLKTLLRNYFPQQEDFDKLKSCIEQREQYLATGDSTDEDLLEIANTNCQLELQEIN